VSRHAPDGRRRHVRNGAGYDRTSGTSPLTLGRGQVRIAKEKVISLLRERGEHDRAIQLAAVLPYEVDTDEDAGLLQRYEIQVSELTEE
jgi:hypothetical protein